jgi:hypothetical protein
MAVGDDAAAAGYPLVPGSGTGGKAHDGYIEINRTRDFVAQVKSLILSTWPVNKGGTGSTTAAGARTNLGISSGTAAASDAVGGNVDGNIYLKIIP